jgi:hypothetical protein
VAREKMMDALAASHLTVHSIDPSGLVSGMPLGSGNGRPGGDAPARRQQMLENTMQMMSDHGSLDVLPEVTGGRSIVSTNAPELKVPEILQESDAYYVVGYEPATETRADTRRSVEVKVARGGARVTALRARSPEPAETARTGAGARSTLDFALAGLLPEVRLPLSMSTAAFAADTFVDRHATLRIRFPLALLPPGRYVMRVEASRAPLTAFRAVAFTLE